MVNFCVSLSFFCRITCNFIANTHIFYLLIKNKNYNRIVDIRFYPLQRGTQMEIRSSGRKKLQTIILGVIPIVLTIVISVFCVLSVNMKVRMEERQRAADGAANAAVSLQWMLESGVEKLEQFARTGTESEIDVQKLLAGIQSEEDFGDFAIAYENQIYYSNGEITNDFAPEKYPNCEIDGKLVRISAAESGIQLRMTSGNDFDLICIFDETDIKTTLGGIFTGNYYCAIYNVRTGTYVYSSLPFEGSGYYDALMSINEKGDGEALFSAYTAQACISGLFGKEDGVVAQCATEISPWGVSLVLPESSFEEAITSMNYLYVIIAVCVALQLAFSLLFLILVLRSKRLLSGVIREDKLAAHEKLEMSVEYTGVCIYEYDRNLGQIVDFHDGMTKSNPEIHLRPRTIREFIAYFKPNDDDALRLYEIFAEIRSGETVNADVHAFADDADHSLRFHLSCMDDGNTIIGSVRDCTQDELSELRIQDEEKYLEMMKPKCASIWDIRVTKNQVCISYDKRGNTLRRFGVKVGEWIPYAGDFPERFREQLHPSDADQFIAQLSLSDLANMYRSGNTESVCDCRVLSLRREGYEWHRRVLRVYKDPESMDIMARLYMLNVDAEKNAEMERRERFRIHQQALMAIGSIYYGLYYIELDNDLCYTAKSHAGELCSDICRPFKTAFDDYIEQYVHPEDRAALKRLLDPYQLRRQILEDRHFLRCEFRCKVGEHYEWSAAIIQAARFENAQIRDVVLAFEDISDIKTESIE